MGFWIKFLIYFVGLSLFTWGARFIQKVFDRFLHSRKCVRRNGRIVTFGWLPILFAGIAFVVIFLLFGFFILTYDEMPVLEMLIAPLGYALLAYALAILVQYIILFYPKLYVQDHTLYMKGFFTQKAIPFEELQKGRRLMKPFFYKDKLYLKLEQGSIFITPDMYWGGRDFLNGLFAELDWDPAILRRERAASPHAAEEQAMYEMLVKEQEIQLKKSLGIWHNRG